MIEFLPFIKNKTIFIKILIQDDVDLDHEAYSVKYFVK